MANLVNSGILPMTFADEADFDKIKDGDRLVMENIREQLAAGNELEIQNKTGNYTIKVRVSLSERQVKMMLAGGLLNLTRTGDAV